MNAHISVSQLCIACVTGQANRIQKECLSWSNIDTEQSDRELDVDLLKDTQNQTCQRVVPKTTEQTEQLGIWTLQK